MGLNVSKSFYEANQTLDNKIDIVARSSARVNCETQVKNIILRGARGCQANIENRCIAQSNSYIDTIKEAYFESFKKLDNIQKASVLPGWNVNWDDTRIQQEINNKINLSCIADAESQNRILVGDIILEDCRNSTVTTSNLGSAQANCGAKLMQTDFLKAQTVINNRQYGFLSDIFDMIQGNLIIASTSLFIYCVCLCFIFLIVILLLIPRP